MTNVDGVALSRYPGGVLPNGVAGRNDGDEDAMYDDEVGYGGWFCCCEL
jgi:hypothetical protein